MAKKKLYSDITWNKEQFFKALDDIVATGVDLRVPFAAVGRDFRKSRINIFSKSRTGPGQYIPLSPKYAKAKQRKVG